MSKQNQTPKTETETANVETSKGNLERLRKAYADAIGAISGNPSASVASRAARYRDIPDATVAAAFDGLEKALAQARARVEKIRAQPESEAQTVEVPF